MFWKAACDTLGLLGAAAPLHPSSSLLSSQVLEGPGALICTPDVWAPSLQSFALSMLCICCSHSESVALFFLVQLGENGWIGKASQADGVSKEGEMGAQSSLASHLDRFFFFFFFTLVTGPRRSLSLKLSDARVYAPQTRARLGTLLACRSSSRTAAGARSSSTPPHPRSPALPAEEGENLPAAHTHTTAATTNPEAAARLLEAALLPLTERGASASTIPPRPSKISSVTRQSLPSRKTKSSIFENGHLIFHAKSRRVLW